MVTSDFCISRTRLLSVVLERPEPIVLVRAPAGMGKSTLLRQIAACENVEVHPAGSPPLAGGRNRLTLWDIPPNAACHGLPEPYVEGSRRLIVAARSTQAIPGLHRARAYGRVFLVDWTRLVFGVAELSERVGSAAARRIIKATGGWPVLVSLYAGDVPDGEVLREFLAAEVLPTLSAEELVALEEVANGHLRPMENLEGIAPFLSHNSDGTVGLLPALRAVFSESGAGAVIEGMDRQASERLADAYVVHAQTTKAILTLQRASHFDRALDLFIAAKGFFYIYRHGSTEYDAVLAGFPEPFWRQHETLVIALCMQALKRGDIGRARRLLTDFVGAVAANPTAMLSNTRVYSLQMRAFRHLMVIYEDLPITEGLMKRVFTLLDEFPTDAHLERGSFYNAVLEFYMRGRRFAEAEDLAERAYAHYVAADVPILRFYISLHRAIMRLSVGDVVKAAHFADHAEADLNAATFDSPSDGRLLMLLKACIAFEQGRSGALLQFLDAEFDQFSHGEIWPTILEFALQYGSQAFAEHFSPAAAASFLERWRIYQMHSRQFQVMVDILMVVNLQNGNRWQEAAERLALLDLRVDRAFVQNACAELTRIEDRDEIAAAMAWLRHFVFDTPTRSGLVGQLQALHDNLRLTGRQRTSLGVWMAFVHKRNRDLTKARLVLQKTLEHAARFGALAPLAGERSFLNELVDDQRIYQFLTASTSIRQVLRSLSRVGVSASALGGAAGLTRRETKVLLMISEGASNKYVAHALGLSEATVKFHLSNLYRKLGCRKRREAIIAAKSLRLVS